MKIRRKRLLSLLLSACMVLTMLPAVTLPALAEGEHDHNGGDWHAITIGIKDERLAAAIADLPGEKRDIILLAFFLDMNDREIAEKLDMVKRTVQRRRASTLEELKLRLEVLDDEQTAE